MIKTQVIDANTPVVVVARNGGGDSDPATGSRELVIDVFDKPVIVRVRIGSESAGLADIVPLAQTVSEEITKRALEALGPERSWIACRAGCCACCHYLVPLSVPEALRLNRDIQLLPDSRRRLIQRECILKARRILDQGRARAISCHQECSATATAEDLKALSQWYKNLSLTCPFLEDGLCTIYAQRPICCREYFVTGSAKACSGEGGVAEVVRMPVYVTQVLGRLAAELEQTSVEAVMLPLVLLWYEHNAERDRQTWPTDMLVDRFAKIVRDSVGQGFSELATCGVATASGGRFRPTHAV